MDWGTLIGSAWGIAGTLLGSWQNARAARKTADERMQHENRTRFHDKKLVIYADFLVAAADAMKVAMSVIYSSSRDPELENLKQRRNETMDRLQTVNSSISLIGKVEVAEAASNAFFALINIADASQASLSKKEEAALDFHAKLARVQEAMRQELQTAAKTTG
jgi:hypothetical protein